MKLYYHKTDGGAEYLTDKYVVCPNGEKEGIFEGANYVVRIDGDITKDAELSTRIDLKELKEEILNNLTDKNAGKVTEGEQEQFGALVAIGYAFKKINKVFEKYGI